MKKNIYIFILIIFLIENNYILKCSSDILIKKSKNWIDCIFSFFKENKKKENNQNSIKDRSKKDYENYLKNLKSTDQENHRASLKAIENQKKIMEEELKLQKQKELNCIKKYQSIFEKLQKYNISINKNNFLERFNIFYNIAEKNLNIIYNLVFDSKNNKINLKSKINYFKYEISDIKKIQIKLSELKDNLNIINDNSFKNEYLKNNLEKNFYQDFLFFIYNYINIEKEFLSDLLNNTYYILFSENIDIENYKLFLSYSPESFISKYI